MGELGGGCRRKPLGRRYLDWTGSVWLGILYLIKDEVLEFLGEPVGKFVTLIPAG